MAEATDLSFLFHQLELFPPMIKRIYANPSLAPRLPVTIAGTKFGLKFMKSVKFP